MCLSDALAWLGSAFFPLRLPPLQVQENPRSSRTRHGRGPVSEVVRKKLRNTWRKKWTPPRVRGHRTLKLNKTPAPTPTVQAQPQSADDQRGKTTWRNSSSREPATPDPSWPNTRASNHGPLYRTMWALLMELLALGGLLSGIHWKVNLGVWLGDWMRHGRLWSTSANHVQRHLVHALGGCRDSRCQVDIIGPLQQQACFSRCTAHVPKDACKPFCVPRMSLFFYYSNERSFLHRELTEMIYWALMYAWLLGALSAMVAGRHSLVPNVSDLKSFENVRII